MNPTEEMLEKSEFWEESPSFCPGKLTFEVAYGHPGEDVSFVFGNSGGFLVLLLLLFKILFIYS